MGVQTCRPKSCGAGKVVKAFCTMPLACCRPVKLPCDHPNSMTVYNPNSGSSVAMQQTYRGHTSQLPTLLGMPTARQENETYI